MHHVMEKLVAVSWFGAREEGGGGGAYPHVMTGRVCERYPACIRGLGLGCLGKP